jgi:hypothetical protein
MEITQQLRALADESGVTVEQAVEQGLSDKAAEYRRSSE